MSARSFPASAASITDSTELGFDTSSSVSRILGDATCSRHGGPESQSTTTYELWVSNQRRELRQMEVAPAVTEPGGFTQAPFLVETTYALSPEAERSGEALTPSPDAEGRMRLRPPSFGLYVDESPTLQAGRPPSICSVAGSRARTSPSPASGEGSPGSDPACSTSSHESLSLFDLDGFSSRTYPGCSPRTAVGTSESLLERWPTSGTAWHGGFSTHVSSECRSAGGVCSSSEPSLSEILQPPQTVPGRYSLSGRAAQGILRRAEKRGRILPPHLQAALEAVAKT